MRSRLIQAGRDPESGEPADDVATLYSWANLHGAKYKDFSASREQVRAQMRQRTLANQAQIAREEAQKAPPRESLRWEDLLPGAGSQGGGGRGTYVWYYGGKGTQIGDSVQDGTLHPSRRAAI